MGNLETRLRELLDKQEIHEALMRYCRGVDRLDGELIASAFHPDAIDDHGAYYALGADVAEVIIGASTGDKTAVHFIGNELVELEDDVAFSETYFMAFLTVERNGRDYTRTRSGRYVDRFERRNGQWKIAYRYVANDWNAIDEVGSPANDRYHPSSRLKDDPVYAIRSMKARPKE